MDDDQQERVDREGEIKVVVRRIAFGNGSVVSIPVGVWTRWADADRHARECANEVKSLFGLQLRVEGPMGPVMQSMGVAMGMRLGMEGVAFEVQVQKIDASGLIISSPASIRA